MTTLLDELQRTGWTVVRALGQDRDSLEQDVTTIAGSLGTLAGMRDRHPVQALSPYPSDVARASSLSRKYGLGTFPFHCDTAHWPVPCRFVVLGCLEPGQTPAYTTLLDTQRLQLTAREKALAEQSLFFVRNGRKSFYASILSPRRSFARVDPGCLEPCSDDAAEALSLFAPADGHPATARVMLEKGDVLVIDNWRTLHGREAVSAPDSNRELLRSIVL
ncbi:MAG TPA: TauD/TfdA family dioxygenase [Rhodocyclaceae bacterium]|nr:TauD/TfdA family dioxygenase [Rhodocyclaceae bacterium]